MSVWGFLQLLLLWIKVFWFRMNQFLFGNFLCSKGRAVGNLTHGIMLVGDGLAAGFGDYITLFSPSTGVCRHLNPLLRKKQKFTHRWEAINGAQYKSTSADWNPLGNSLLADSLWKQSILSPSYKHAEIVVVCLGLEDTNLDMYETVENIKSVSKTCTELGKYVVVCLVPLCDTLVSEETFSKVYATNELIENWIKLEQPEKVQLLKLNNFRFNQPNMYCGDKRHFSSAGYGLFAKVLLEQVENTMVKVEFSVNKKLLKIK